MPTREIATEFVEYVNPISNNVKRDLRQDFAIHSPMWFLQENLSGSSRRTDGQWRFPEFGSIFDENITARH